MFRMRGKYDLKSTVKKTAIVHNSMKKNHDLTKA